MTAYIERFWLLWFLSVSMKNDCVSIVAVIKLIIYDLFLNWLKLD